MYKKLTEKAAKYNLTPDEYLDKAIRLGLASMDIASKDDPKNCLIVVDHGEARRVIIRDEHDSNITPLRKTEVH